MSETEQKMAPVQGYIQGIPWEMHLRAYDAYCKKYSRQEALITGGCRGGFHVEELDLFIPGWREELNEIGKLERELTAAHADLAAKDAEIARALDERDQYLSDHDQIKAQLSHELSVLRITMSSKDRQLTASQQRETELREALETFEKETAHLFWTSDDGENIRDGSPDDMDGQKPFTDAWRAARLLLATAPNRPTSEPKKCPRCGGLNCLFHSMSGETK